MIYNYTSSTNNIFNTMPPYPLEQAKSAVETKNTNVINREYDKGQTKSPSKKKKILFGSTIASTILTAGIIGLIGAKGLHGTKNLSKFKDKLAREIQEAGQISSKDIPAKTIFYTKKAMKKGIDGMQAASNFTCLKDYLFNKLCSMSKTASKFCSKAASFFKKIVDKTLGKKYNKVEINIKDLASLLRQYKIADIRNLDSESLNQQINIKGNIKTLSEWLNILEAQTKRMETSFDGSFSLGARKMRDTKRQNLLSNLPAKIHERFFKNKSSIFKLENYKTYATEDISRPAQEILKHDITRAKKEITNNISSITENIRNNIHSLNDIIKPEDETSRTLIRQLKKQLEAFKKCSGPSEEQVRRGIVQEINKLLDDFILSINANTKYNRHESEAINLLSKSIKETIEQGSKNSKGALEEIMTILKGLKDSNLNQSNGQKLISDNLYKEIDKMSKKISKGLEEASELEIGEYFLKQAELKVGSAPTDILSILFPIGAGTYAIAKGDNKDEKISAILTTCIPLVGTFAAFVYGTTKMLSGAKNLAFSLISGAALSVIGDYSDKMYKKYKKTGIEKIVKDEYDKFWTGLETQIQKFEEPKK